MSFTSIQLQELYNAYTEKKMRWVVLEYRTEFIKNGFIEHIEIISFHKNANKAITKIKKYQQAVYIPAIINF